MSGLCFPQSIYQVNRMFSKFLFPKVLHLHEYELDSCDRDSIDIQYRLSILNANGKKCKILGNVDKHGGLYKIQPNYLLDNERKFLRDQKLTIFCEVKEVDNEVKNVITSEMDYPTKTNFQSLLESAKFADFTLIVGGKKLSAHKNILAARSKVFAAMFEHDCKETQQNCVEITDITVEAFELLLRYIYTGKHPEFGKYGLDLFVASDKYQLIELKQACEDYLKNNLNLQTVVDTLILADMHQAPMMKSKCIELINNDVDVVKLTKGWKILSTKAHLMTELFLNMKEQRDKLKPINNLHSTPENSNRDSYLIPPQYRRNLNLSQQSQQQVILPKLFQDFQKLLETRNLSDVTMLAGENKLSAHKSILAAQSNVFLTIFEKDKQLNQLEVKMNAQVCEQMLNYIYTDYIEPEKLGEYSHELLLASNEYNLYHLNYLCEKTLSSGINNDTVCKTLLLAHSMHAAELKLKCMDYIVEHSKLLIRTETWKELIESKPELGGQLFECLTAKQWF